ncbi:MAG: RNA polymerase subunit sigma-70, partial [Lachnospiraceae bacterium]|nr:RNA polymerase subunit sigma-70 [Lachnospiraceae bacterium]
MEDSKIIDLYLNRDESAISHTADKYGSMLGSVSKRITGDAEEAEECVNDTYLEAWNRIPPSKPRDYFPAFLSRIVRNISINRCVQR